MLFDGALVAIVKAKTHMEKREIVEKGNSISKAIMIIDSGLRGGLNFEVGGEIAQTLNSLYAYMSQQLMQANLKNDPALLDEVYTLLTDIKGAWVAIGTQGQQAASTNLDTNTSIGV
jgi:flagellar protein FliS